MFLNNPFPGAFGLDIGDCTLKLVQLRHRGGAWHRPASFVVQNIRQIAMPPGVIVHGEIAQPEVARKKILELLSATKSIHSPWVVADLPEAQTFLKLIDVGNIAGDLTSADVSAHAAQHLPFSLEETYLDWQIIPPADEQKTTNVLVGAVPKIIADSYTYLLEAAGLSPLALEIEAISLARAMITEAKDYSGEARAILDLGASRASLVIFDKNTIQFSIHLNFSAQKMTRTIAENLACTTAEAENLRLKKGFTQDEFNPKYLMVIDGLVGELIGEIKRALQFYKEHFTLPNPITRIIMCGGLAGAENLCAVLSQKLRVACRPGNAWKNVTTDTTINNANNGITYASAIGLALRAARNPLQNDL